MMIRPKLFRLIRKAMKAIETNDEVRCKSLGVGKQAMLRGEFTTQLFQKSILSLMSARNYYADPTAGAQLIRDEVQKLVDEGYLTSMQIGASIYYKPTTKLTTGVDND